MKTANVITTLAVKTLAIRALSIIDNIKLLVSGDYVPYGATEQT